MEMIALALMFITVMWNSGLLTPSQLEHEELYTKYKCFTRRAVVRFVLTVFTYIYKLAIVLILLA